MVAAAHAAPNGNPLKRNWKIRSLGLPHTFWLYRQTSFLKRDKQQKNVTQKHTSIIWVHFNWQACNLMHNSAHLLTWSMDLSVRVSPIHSVNNLIHEFFPLDYCKLLALELCMAHDDDHVLPWWFFKYFPPLICKTKLIPLI